MCLISVDISYVQHTSGLYVVFFVLKKPFIVCIPFWENEAALEHVELSLKAIYL